tara:strand:- start:687 stop:1058 length:372 start_codon:yes stop_codon:yes gene_type:complete
MNLKLGKDNLPQPRKVVAASSNKEGKHYGVQGSRTIVKQSAPKKHLYGMGGIRSMKLHPPKLHNKPDAILKPHSKPLHEVMKEHGMKPPTVHTQIKHDVVGTNTRGASTFLKGATAPSQDKKN